MALVLKDRVKETTTTTGTGSFALAGAVTGYDSFGQIGNGNTTYYAVYLDGGSEWEVGIGTYTSPSTLSRDTILASSNAGSAVNFSAGQKTIWCDYPAGKAVYLDASGSISEPIVNISGVTGAISTVDTIAFDTTYATTLTAGQIGWNGNDTLGLGMIGGNVVQHIGEDTFFYVKASSAITKGQLCMFTGAVGASGVLTAAPATAIPYAEAIIGVAAENIALGAFGLIQNTGTLRGVDTSAFLDGDILYYNSAVTGGFTKTFPTSGPIVIVAAVAKSGAGTSGVLSVRVSFQTRVTASTGISVTQGNDVVTVTNSAPDQVVSLTGTGTTTITGTYPNFTINSDDQFDGTVTSVGGTGTVNGITLTGTVTSSGNLTLGGTLSGVNLASQVTGTLPIANGGTGQTTASDAFDALNPMTTLGDIIYEETGGTASRLGIGTSGQILTVSGGKPAWATPASGGGVAWQSVQTSSFTAVAGQAYPVDTTSNAITVTLPSSPTAGQLVSITDYAGTFDTNNCTINPNGNKIQSSTSNQILKTASQSVGLVYIDSTQGWLVYDGFLTSPIPRNYQVNYLVIAGGGGGGGNLSGGTSGGGGGAGGYRASTLMLTPSTSYTITVGGGGSAGGVGVNGGNGSDSVFSTITSTGGGGGGGVSGGAGLSGGSGGGSNIFSVSGGSGTSGQGNDGGNAASNNLDAGGGGGASAVGGNASSGVGGNGGNGSASSITGSSVTRGGGGGGGSYLGTRGTGGTGGGGNGAVSGTAATAGSANTGGGGGGGARTSGGTAVASAAGGSGVVILSIPTSRYSGITTGSPSVTTSGSNTILTYNSSGTYTA